MTPKPRVSVCIPSYNHARYLPAAIESVLAQSYKDFEIVIVDDGSTDDSLQIAESYAARYPEKIRVHTHPGGGNRGISETVNLGYGLTSSEFWMGLPSDDMLYPDKLERQVAFLHANPSVGWVYSYGDWIDEAGRPLPERGLFGEDVTRVAQPLHRLIERNCVPGMTALMRRSCTERVGLHEPGLVYSDWEFWLRMLAQCRAAFIARPLIHYRVHAYNTSGGQVGERENAKRALAVIESIRGKAEAIGGAIAEPRTRALLNLQIAYYSYRLEDDAGARRSLAAAFEEDPALREDSTFFARWLRERVFELYHALPPDSTKLKFAEWLCRYLPTVGSALARKAAAASFAEGALGARRLKAQGGWRNALKCFLKDPAWLADGSLQLIFLEGVLGSWLVGMMRRGKAMVQRPGRGGMADRHSAIDV